MDFHSIEKELHSGEPVSSWLGGGGHREGVYGWLQQLPSNSSFKAAVPVGSLPSSVGQSPELHLAFSITLILDILVDVRHAMSITNTLFIFLLSLERESSFAC